MVKRKAAARVGLGLLAAVVAATRRTERSSIVAIKKGRRQRREGKEGMLVRRLVGRAAGEGRGVCLVSWEAMPCFASQRVPCFVQHHHLSALDFFCCLLVMINKDPSGFGLAWLATKTTPCWWKGQGKDRSG